MTTSSITIHDRWAEALTADIAAAHESITISALSMLPPRHITEAPLSRLWEALRAAAAREVEVTIYLAEPTAIHRATLQNGTTGLIAHRAGMTTHFVPQPQLLHAKTAIIDRLICWVGSGNFTAAAAHYNHELYCRFSNTEIAARIAARWAEIAKK